MSALSSTTSATAALTATATAIASTATAAGSAAAAVPSSSTVNSAHQFATSQLASDPRVDALALLDMATLKKRLNKASDSDKISELKAAIKIRQAKHQESTGQSVGAHASAATATAAAPISLEPQQATLEAYKSNPSYAKSVIVIAINSKLTDAELKFQTTSKDSNSAELHKMAIALRQPLPEKQIKDGMTFVPHFYQGVKCAADIIINMINHYSNHSMAELKDRYKEMRKMIQMMPNVSVTSDMAVMLYLMDKKAAK